MTVHAVPIKAEVWMLEAGGAPLVRRTLELPDPSPTEAIVEVLACGLCHTDLGFADGSVPPSHALPLVLGHEIVGKVVAGPAKLMGHTVIVPAVLPCGECAFCRSGRGNACPTQAMPGKDIHGGFATHVLVPARPLVPVDVAPEGFDLRELSVVADAVSTAYQAVQRSNLGSGDVAFVVGAGGVGAFIVQIAHAEGAHVIALDVQADRLALMAAHGADRTISVGGVDPKDVRKEAHALAKKWNVPSLRYRIFECGGTPASQSLAYGLLSRAATLVQVGYTPKPIEVRFSNLMAFDATVHGSWGCPPEVYPEVLDLIWRGEVVLTPFVDYVPMSRINECLADMAAHKLTRRMILDPRS